MEDKELTSGLKDFFSNEEDSTSGSSRAVGGVGTWLLHLVVFAFAIYSGYHGISATMRYHGGGLGTIAGVVGILVIEVVLIGIYLAYFNRRITGDGQKIAAAATLAIGFTLSCLGIVGDSQMQAGMSMSGWLSAYLMWGLPIAPALMALGAAVVMAAEPGHLRKMKEAAKDDEFAGKKHAKRMAAKEADLMVAQQLANMQLNGKMDAARYALDAYRTPEVQAFIQRSALANMPEMMRAIGVNLPYGTVVEGQVIEPRPVAAPARGDGETAVEQATRMATGINEDAAPKRSILDRLLGRENPDPVNVALVAAIMDAMKDSGELGKNAHDMTEEEKGRFFDMYEQARREAAGQGQPTPAPTAAPVSHANGQEGNGSAPRP